MSDRFRTRRGVVVLAGALSAFAVLPVAADSQIPGSDALKGGPTLPNLERAVDQLEGLKQRPSAPQHSEPGGTRPAAPQRSAPAPSARPAPRRAATAGGAVRQRATTSGTGSHAGVAPSSAGSSRGSSSGTAARAAAAKAPSSGTARATRAVARPTVVSPGSDVQNDPSLPFTGSRPLDVLALGLLAFAVGLVARRTLRLRRHAQA